MERVVSVSRKLFTAISDAVGESNESFESARLSKILVSLRTCGYISGYSLYKNLFCKFTLETALNIFFLESLESDNAFSANTIPKTDITKKKGNGKCSLITLAMRFVQACSALADLTYLTITACIGKEIKYSLVGFAKSSVLTAISSAVELTSWHVLEHVDQPKQPRSLNSKALSP